MLELETRFTIIKDLWTFLKLLLPSSFNFPCYDDFCHRFADAKEIGKKKADKNEKNFTSFRLIFLNVKKTVSEERPVCSNQMESIGAKRPRLQTEESQHCCVSCLKLQDKLRQSEEAYSDLNAKFEECQNELSAIKFQYAGKCSALSRNQAARLNVNSNRALHLY